MFYDMHAQIYSATYIQCNCFRAKDSYIIKSILTISDKISDDLSSHSGYRGMFTWYVYTISVIYSNIGQSSSNILKLNRIRIMELGHILGPY